MMKQFFLALTLLFSSIGYGGDFQPKMPEDLESVDFYLHTINLGALIHEKYGHTQIRIHDRKSGLDVAYSWGIFNYQDPNFAINFYKGIMVYSIGAYSIRTAHRIYKAEGRTVWEDKINLNTDQKRRIMEKIIHDMQPEHRSYGYQYFFDNCSTRPRDFINHAISGALGKSVAGKNSSRSFRNVVRNYQATTPMTSLALEVTMNSNLDRVMTLQEEMFLPQSLRDRLLELSLVDSDGVQTGDGKLLTPMRVYYRKDTPKATWWIDDLFTVLFFGLLPLLMYLIFLKSGSGFWLRPFGLVVVIWGLLASVYGIVMPVSWGVSAHLDLHHNMNMMIFWPVDILYIYWGSKLIVAGANARLGPRGWQILRYFVKGHVALLVALAALNIAGLVEQNSLRIVFTYGACMILLQSIMYRHFANLPKATHE